MHGKKSIPQTHQNPLLWSICETVVKSNQINQILFKDILFNIQLSGVQRGSEMCALQPNTKERKKHKHTHGEVFTLPTSHLVRLSLSNILFFVEITF